MYTRAQRVVADCCRTTPTQCHLLTELGRAGPLSASELAARVLLERSWVSRALDTMVEETSRAAEEIARMRKPAVD